MRSRARASAADHDQEKGTQSVAAAARADLATLRARAARAWSRDVAIVAAVAVVLIAAYIATRLILIATFPYFVDEGILARYVDAGADPDRRFDPLSAALRPGAIWLATAVASAADVSSLTALRVVAAAAGLVMLGAGAALAYRLGGLPSAGFFGLVTVSSPFLLLHGPLAVRDAVVAAAAVTALVLQIELARRPRLGVALLLGVALGAGLLTKESGKVAIWLLPLSLLAFRWRGPRPVRRLAGWTGGALLAVGVAYLAEVPLRQLTTRMADYDELLAQQAVVRPLSETLRSPGTQLAAQWPFVQEALVAYLTVPALLLVALGTVQGLRRTPALTALVASWALLQLGSIMAVGDVAPYPRYLAPGMPLVLVLAAYGLAELVRVVRASTAPAAARAAVGGVLVALAFLPAATFSARILADPASAPYPSLDREQYVTGWASGYGLDDISDALTRLSGGEEMLVAAYDNFFHQALFVLLQEEPQIVFGDLDAETLERTPWVLLNGGPMPDGIGALTPIFVVHRPDGGTPIGIYRSGDGAR